MTGGSKEVGSGHVAIVPTMVGFRAALNREADAATADASDRMKKGFADAGQDAGKQAGNGFASAFDQASDTEKVLAPFNREVAQASRALSSEREKQRQIAGQVRVAELKLAEAVEKSGEESSQAVAAEERLATARRRQDAVTKSVESASERLADAQDRQARATEAAERAAEEAARELAQLEGEARDAARALDDIGDEVAATASGLDAVGDAAQNTARDLDRMGDEAQSGARKADSAVSGFGSVAKNVLGGIVVAAAAAATAAIGAIAVGSISAAADLEQSLGAVDAVFGTYADSVHGFAEDAAIDVGLSANAYNELATILGSQLKNGGLAMDEIGGKTNELIGLGADLASMFGGTTADAVGALSSALRGERDPIEAYGVSLNQAAIDAKAAELGFEKVGGALSTEANQAATLALVMEQTAQAHGNFAAEVDTLSHKQQVLAAQWQDMQALIGTAFLPAVSALLDVASTSLMPVLEELGVTLASVFSDAQPAIEELAAQLGPILSDVLTGVVELIPALAPVAAAIGGVFGALAPIVPPILDAVGLLASAMGGVLASVITALLPIVEKLVAVLGPAMTSIMEALAPHLGVIGELFAVLIEALSPILDAVLGLMGPLLGLIGPLISLASPIIMVVAALAPLIELMVQMSPLMLVILPLLTWLAELLEGLLAPITGMTTGMDGISSSVGGVSTVVQGFVTGALTMLSDAIAAIPAVVAWLVATWRSHWDQIIHTVATVWMRIQGTIQVAVDIVVGIWNGFIETVKGAGEGLFAWIGGIPDTIRGFFEGVGDWLVDAGRSLIQGFIDGISSMVNAVGDAVGGLVDFAAEFFPHSPAKRGAFAGTGYTSYSGRALASDFAGGMLSAESDVVRAAESITRAAAFSSSSTHTSGMSESAGAGWTFNITVNGTNADPREIAREVFDEFRYQLGGAA